MSINGKVFSLTLSIFVCGGHAAANRPTRHEQAFALDSTPKILDQGAAIFHKNKLPLQQRKGSFPGYLPSSAFVRRTTLSTVKPYSAMIFSPGAEAPNRSMAKMSPSAPT